MSKIKINNLKSNQLEYQELSDKASKLIFGGREVTKIDLDDDGRWDIKIVETKNTLKVKVR